MIVIPYRELSDDALYGVVEEFINREGTDYGEFELSLHQKTHRLMQQVMENRAYIVFDEETETTSILSTQQLLDLGVNPKRAVLDEE